MTTEVINIRITEDGSRVVKRNIQDIGQTSIKAADGVDWLKRVLAGLASVLAVDKIRQWADAWASAAGSIRIATESTAQAIAVQNKLFKSAQDTRTAYSDIVELYSRAARAGKELGASQNELIKFSENVGKSLAVQHVSAETARGALMQLGQAIGGTIVRAEEFNSIMEGAPYILQIVAKNIKGMDGSVSKLRKMMIDGKLTSKIFFDAFLKGSKDIDADFAKSSLTIGQGFTLMSNAMMKYIGELDEAVGFSHAFGEASKFVATNLGSILGVLGSVTAGVATYFGIIKAMEWGAAVAGQVKFVYAVATGRAVMLGSADAALQMAAAQATASAKSAAAAEAELAATTQANLGKLTSTVAVTEAKVAEIAATQSGIIVSREAALAALAKSNADIQSARTTIAAAQAAGALSYALATARAATLELAAAEQARNVALAELAVLGQQQARVSVLATEAMVAQTAATKALQAAQAQAATTGAAAANATAVAASGAAAATAKAAAGTSVVARTLSALGLGALANPWVLLAAALVTATALLYKFGDAMNVGLGKLTTLSDIFRAIGEIAREGFSTVGKYASEAFGVIGGYARAAYEKVTGETDSAVGGWLRTFTSFYDDVGGGFAGVVKGIAKTLDALTGLFIGAGIAMYRSWAGLPDVLGNVFKEIYNVGAEYIEKLLNMVIDGVNKIRSAIGASLLETVSITKLDVDQDAFKKYGENIASSIDAGFEAESGFFLKAVENVMTRAQRIAAERNVIEHMGDHMGQLDNKGNGGKPVIDDKALQKAENALRSLLHSIDPVEAATHELAKSWKVLDEAQHLGLITDKQKIQYLSALYEKYNDILDPVGAMNREIEQQIKLLNMSASARAVESQYLQIQQDMMAKGVDLRKAENQGQAEAIRAGLMEMQSLNVMVQAQDQLLADSVGKREQFVTQLQAIMKLMSDPTSGFGAGDAATATSDLLKNMGVDPTLLQTGLTAQMAQFDLYYAHIAQLREKGLIGAQDEAAANAQIWAQQQTARLKQTDDFFGQLAQMQDSRSKTAARIGKAAAIAQATIKTYESATSAYAAMAGIPYVGPALGVAAAAAAVVAGMANVQAIRNTPGFKTGGFTGNGGVNDIAGVVHGREFVMDAQRTEMYRPELESMHRGDFQSGGGLKLNIENYGTGKEYEVQQLSADEYRLIARDEIRKMTPEVVAGEVTDANSRTSKALRDHTQGGGRKR